MREAICMICGKPFLARNNRENSCSPECAKIRDKENNIIRMREYHEKEKHIKVKKNREPSELAIINAKARKAGMTYGQYVAKMGI